MAPSAHINMGNRSINTGAHEAAHVLNNMDFQNDLIDAKGNTPDLDTAHTRGTRYDVAKIDKDDLMKWITDNGFDPKDYAADLAKYDLSLKPGAKFINRIKAQGYGFENTPRGRGLTALGRAQALLQPALGIDNPNGLTALGLDYGLPLLAHTPKFVEEMRASSKVNKLAPELAEILGKKMSKRRMKLNRNAMLLGTGAYLLDPLTNGAANHIIGNIGAYSDHLDRGAESFWNWAGNKLTEE